MRYAGPPIGNSLPDISARSEAETRYTDCSPPRRLHQFARASRWTFAVSLVSARRRVLSAAAGATIVALFTLPVDVTAAETVRTPSRACRSPDRATVTDARTVAANTAPVLRTARVLSCVRDDRADRRLGHQGGSVAADQRLEREVSGGRQRRRRRRHQLRRHDRGGPPRIRHQFDRHRPRRQHHGLRARAPRQVRRLRLSRRSRDDGQRQGHRRGVLRHGAGALVLERLLAGRPPGHHRSDPLPRRFRRDYRRRAGASPTCSCTRCGWR